MKKDFEKEKEESLENLENVTKYGEMVCTEFKWLPLEKQKEKAEKLDKITKKNSKK